MFFAGKAGRGGFREVVNVAMREPVMAVPDGKLDSERAPRAATPGDVWLRQRRRVTIALFVAPVAVMALLFVAPMLELVRLSLSGENGITLEGYAELLRPVYLRLMLFTFELALEVTLLCLVIGYPLAFLLANIQGAFVRWLTLALLISLWLSVLSRTYSWVILLQRNGVVNNFLVWSGIADAPVGLVYNEVGVLIGMTHILLPFMVLTLVPALRAIDPVLVRSAASLGAGPFMVFRRIYFPLSLPGVVAGSILVFTMALGFFITPAILGGGKTTTIVMAIRNQVQQLVDLRLASATSVVLLLVCFIILLLYERLSGVDRLFGAGKQ